MCLEHIECVNQPKIYEAYLAALTSKIHLLDLNAPYMFTKVFFTCPVSILGVECP